MYLVRSNPLNAPSWTSCSGCLLVLLGMHHIFLWNSHKDLIPTPLLSVGPAKCILLSNENVTRGNHDLAYWYRSHSCKHESYAFGRAIVQR